MVYSRMSLWIVDLKIWFMKDSIYEDLVYQDLVYEDLVSTTCNLTVRQYLKEGFRVELLSRYDDVTQFIYSQHPGISITPE